MRSAEKTTAAALFSLVILGAAGLGLRSPLGLSPPPSASLLSPLQPQACPNCCLSTQTRTFRCQQKHTWRWHCHPTPCRQHTPTHCLPLSKLCSHTHSAPLPPRQHSWSPLLGTQPSTLHTFSVGFSHACSRRRLTLVVQASTHSAL